MAVYKRGKVWYIDYYYQGERVRERVGPNKQTAEDALDARKGEIAQGRFKLQAARPSPLLEDFAKEYLEWARVNHRSAKSMAASRLDRLLPFFREKRLRDLTPWLIERYKAERRKMVTPATVNRDLQVLSSLLSRAVEWGKLTEHPMKGGKVKKLPELGTRERVLTAEEETRLLKHSTPELQDLILLALDTGMRLGEIVSLTPADVDLAHREARLRHTKNGKERRLPLTARAVGILTDRGRALAAAAPYFPPRPGQRPWRLKSAWQDAVREAGLKGLRFHDLRHTFATRLVTGGADLVTVQHLLGHGDLRMTSRYAHPTSASVRHAVALLEEAGNRSHKMVTTGKLRGRARRLSA